MLRYEAITSSCKQMSKVIALKPHEGSDAPIYVQATVAETISRRPQTPTTTHYDLWEHFVGEGGDHYFEIAPDGLKMFPHVKIKGERPNIKVEPYSGTSQVFSPEDEKRLALAIQNARISFAAQEEPTKAPPIAFSDEYEMEFGGRGILLKQGQEKESENTRLLFEGKLVDTGEVFSFVYDPEGDEFDETLGTALEEL